VRVLWSWDQHCFDAPWFAVFHERKGSNILQETGKADERKNGTVRRKNRVKKT
jgi:hypothetical protein